MYFQSNNKKKTTNNLTEKLNFILENNFNKCNIPFSLSLFLYQ